MAERQNIKQGAAPQTAPPDVAGLAERLTEHANNVRNPAAKAMAEDMRQAARVLAEWQVGVTEVIHNTKKDDTRVRLAKLVRGLSTCPNSPPT